MKKFDRKAMYDFLDSLLSECEGEHEQVALLKDILVQDFCFVGDEHMEADIAGMDAEIIAMMKQNPGQKIHCIKIARERLEIGLAEAKHYVEALAAGDQPPAMLRQKFNKRSVVASKALVKERLNMIGARFGLPAVEWEVEE